MYTRFFGLNKKPFSLIPDPEFLYLSPKHQKALSLLQYGYASQTEITVVTGEIGTGKTTLIQSLLRNIKDQCTVGIVTNTHPAFGDLFTWILAAFKIKHDCQTKSERYQVFVNFVLKQNRKKSKVVVFIDEAQNIDVNALEELRLLSNINHGQEMMLQIFLIGQSELLEKLNAPETLLFNQRISINYHLTALNFQETEQYILHRLKIAGSCQNLFDSTALASLYFYTSGIPRLINNICDLALVHAFAEEAPINWETIENVVNEQKLGRMIRYKALSKLKSVCSDHETESEKLQKFIFEKTGIDTSNTISI